MKISILLSDLHIAPFKEEKFKTQRKNFIERSIQFFANILQKKEKNIYEKMKKVVNEKMINVGISNGDLMESAATERGWITERDTEAAKEVVQKLENSLSLGKLELNMGNHESGYILPLSTDDEGGVSLQSIKNFLLVAKRDKLYHSFLIEGFRFIFVPYLFTEQIAKDFDLNKEKEVFLEEMKKDFFLSDEPVVLFIHDPDSLMNENLLSLIQANRKKIKAMFFGHYHSWMNLFFAKILVNIFNCWWLFPLRPLVNVIFWIISGRNMRIVRELGKYFRSRKNIPGIIKKLGMILIPAPTGMFGVGCGFLILEISDNGKLEIKKYS
ncbi:MAG: hypothetical protein ACD_7C00165G0005 [uncultured bacterium]|nr:MAG: hypothetical protein ACD_7C00165G0005 [uncultured bacterium]HBR78844.1 hypothetical protein [Candidatus Moranbacteria bacterium]